LSGLNIYNARDKLQTTTYQVVIAVVDDWVNINLEDLKWKIWTNKKEIPWNGIDDDKNWYIDDYYWWNFFWKNNSITPVGDHWTMIAEIIASITNNSIWIAW
jgi:subtilisin family serine protease